MIRLNESVDDKLRKRLMSYGTGDKNYWSFRGKAAREHAHSYLQYPAMMVPQMQRKLIEIIRELVPGIKSVYDPFVGSGTVLTESMLQGLDFRGQDINPLAVLICRTKRGPFFEKALREKTENLFKNIEADDSKDVDIDFRNIDKWFRPDIAGELSRIRKAIKREPAKWSRRFFWVALSETVRLSSNSRTSTFKLHIRPAGEIKTREISPIEIFKKIVYANHGKLSKIRKLLEANSFIKRDYFTGSVEILLADSTKALNSNGNGNGKNKFDLLVTSPPYGDNATTVPYGQYSYLPLQWIELSDIDEKIDDSYLSTTHAIDSISLGGLKKDALEDSDKIGKLSVTFSETIKSLQDEPRDRAVRVAAFCRDLNNCIDPILDTLKPDAYMIWTIGNRRVGKRSIPMDDILSELIAARGAKNILKFDREIPSKRMAVKNNFADTMRKESILVFKKGNY
ncbi:MAG: site-specific DNA-methyltransferase [Candidatus Aminicenantes bacterium]|nr:site-specific DNA-methyltransferase [Candidatus Aminicenantes bacterium]